MHRKFNVVCLAVLVLPFLAGCTAETAYRTMQTMAKQSCLRQPVSEQERCESRIHKEDYETYEKRRTKN